MAVKLGEQTRVSSGRADPSRLAELASGYAVLALLTAGAEAEAHRGRAHKLLPLIQTPQLDSRSRRMVGANIHPFERIDRAVVMKTIGHIRRVSGR
jgi:hypothetical protein